MKLLGFLLLLITVNSCDNTKNTSNELVGTWRHVESLSDIGDGNATFHRVNSKKTMTFNTDGTVTSNENVCTGNNFQEGSTADWDTDNESFSLGDCQATYSYDADIEELIINYQCIEACGEKYIRFE
ncbi:hypothetical protein SAMN05192588_1045 [Nonlabens sp. Hel1_33_55]|uniref:glycoside hydrolase family 43 C-terminal domain-containing protein n=1 Tax=Nonlabens sp. Hel1_33_55 TaxID=1336802 RepID=UPI000875E4FB|nr:glycoside hydrolase family 43 C-terminal domain-containing protein [Nonlabens sp. Hel1_33_55]SCY08198.1 hypothetical protein SAMN05192588_1045 [Nonlabens sp. Hel1_33_55]